MNLAAVAVTRHLISRSLPTGHTRQSLHESRLITIEAASLDITAAVNHPNYRYVYVKKFKDRLRDPTLVTYNADHSTYSLTYLYVDSAAQVVILPPLPPLEAPPAASQSSPPYCLSKMVQSRSEVKS